MINKFVLVYLDDILLFSKSPQDHVQHVRRVLQRLQENQPYVKAKKCEFHQGSVSFLGFVVSAGRLEMDSAKVKAVVEWPQTTTQKELQRLLGLANYYRFIRSYSSVSAPLTALTSPKVPFSWFAAAEEAFSRLKKAFTKALVLVTPDRKLQCVVEVDASDVGVGAVLSQHSLKDNKLHPCAFSPSVFHREEL